MPQSCACVCGVCMTVGRIQKFWLGGLCPSHTVDKAKQREEPFEVRERTGEKKEPGLKSL